VGAAGKRRALFFVNKSTASYFPAFTAKSFDEEPNRFNSSKPLTFDGKKQQRRQRCVYLSAAFSVESFVGIT
jgi:hypothetical protein